MTTIRLTNGEWRFDPNRQLGRTGGFGAVFMGESLSGQPVAVKQIKITAAQAAHRELRIAKDLLQKDFSNVLRVLDAGYDADTDRYYVVMPKAEGSLQDYIDNKVDFPLPDDFTRDVLLQIARGMQEMNMLVHRDLKPANILLHENRWKIADFGISRFVEESTSQNTLCGCLSPQYAAPEQWLQQKVTQSTDLYALGCIAYALLTKSPPFTGTIDELQQKHLFEAPPDLLVGEPSLRLLVTGLLRKPQESRPTMMRVLSSLETPASPLPSPIAPKLEQLSRLGLKIEQRNAESERVKALEANRIASRSAVASAARDVLSSLVNSLFDVVMPSIPSAKRRQNSSQWIIEIDNASLQFTIPFERYDADFVRSKWKVLHSARIDLYQREPQYEWSASLWYTDIGRETGFRWYEISYFDNPLMGRSRRFTPFCLSPAEADLASSNIIGPHCIAFGPVPIDDEHAETFIARWCELLAKTGEGQLAYPSRMPIP